MKFQLVFTFVLLLIGESQMNAQTDSILSKLTFEADYRFRVEQDWDSRKSDGSFRDDRTRLRYRLRTGATFKNEWYSMGFRIRTGDQNKQQDPQLTLGKGFKEFGTLPLGFEKVFFQGVYENLKFWLGKNSFSFEKNNELFWSDNVFPEGVFVEYNFNFKSPVIEKVALRGSHYILSSNGKSFLSDAYFQGIQSSIHFESQRFLLFPSLYLLRNIPNIPDGDHSFILDYSILHLGGKLSLLDSKKLLIDFDIYQNVEDYNPNTNVLNEIKDEKTGYSIGIQYGAFSNAKDWKFKLTYTKLHRYAALDYMAQNDWARWDYGAFNSPDGRLTNFKGIEVVVGYKLSRRVNFIGKYYLVNQIVPTGLFEETGQRIRFDLNVRV